MFKVFYDDVETGHSETFGSYAVTAEEIIEFVTKYDPQPFHLSDDFAKMTPLGGLCASGWHTCAMMMSMIVANMKERGVASLGAPGVSNINWKIPVRPGDVLHVKSVVEGKRQSKSRPTLGIVDIHSYVYNNHDQEVMDVVAKVLVACRP